ncbi:hypothetical protein Mgra_00009020 [Meloidogyne graminicola]|uniref:Uncharacterized protein n=1 Tax=Meloidogyne graminicola TaxID=189291 RepID=A0A8S9ZEA1_9BILA|nr:hypothetical protein Mgra_00009020 [Meloidogyne graminicola]
MEKNIEIIGDEFLIQQNDKKRMLTTTTKIIKETQQQISPIYELILNSDESSSASLRLANIWRKEKCLIRCAIGDESRQSFIPSTLLLHKNGKKVGNFEEENDGSISYEFIPWEEENNLNKKPILFHCSAEIFPDEAKRKGRRHFPQFTKNTIYQRTLKIIPKIGTFPCENKGNNNYYCKNGGICFEMNNNLINSTFLPFSTLGISSLISFLILIILILNLFLIKEKRKTTKMRKNILKFNNNCINLKNDEKENENTPLEYFYNKKDDPCDNKSSIENNNQQKYLLPSSPIPQILSPSLSRIPRLYSTPQIKRKEIENIQEKEELNFEEENNSKNNSSNESSSASGGEYDNLEKLCEEIQKQKMYLKQKRMECKQNNNKSTYMNLVLLEKGENGN